MCNTQHGNSEKNKNKVNIKFCIINLVIMIGDKTEITLPSFTYYEKKVYAWNMVNNSININNYIYLSPQIMEHKKTMTCADEDSSTGLEQAQKCDRNKPVIWIYIS